MSDAGSNRMATFRGYDRADRPAGVRNTVVVLPSVICSGVVAETIADAIPEATCLAHDHGCGQIGGDRDQTRRTLLNVGRNPNVAGVVVIGLGCETLASESLAADLDIPVHQVAIQTAGGTEEAAQAGKEAVRDLVATAHSDRRTPTTVAELTVGIAISDVAESTVERVAPPVGRLVSEILDVGGQVVVGGLETLVPHADRADELVADETVAESLRECLERHRSEIPPPPIRRTAADRSIDEIVTLWNKESIDAILDYGERIDEEVGLTLVDTEDRFEETTSALAAAGAQLIVHVTADGIPTGHPIVPVFKITGDPDTAAALSRDIDLDATKASERALVERVLLTANGEETAAERHGLSAFSISRVGPSL